MSYPTSLCASTSRDKTGRGRGFYTSQSRCKYQGDVIIDDGVARTASTTERSKIHRYRREMQDYNNRQYGSKLEKGFTQLYGEGLPFRSESSSAPKPHVFVLIAELWSLKMITRTSDREEIEKNKQV
uniref:Uncharacterized protein n=1 Tax=Ditylenchus dipsaci TaxID=166011 RepID=A0A915E4J9_9BILA